MLWIGFHAPFTRETHLLFQKATFVQVGWSGGKFGALEGTDEGGAAGTLLAVPLAATSSCARSAWLIGRGC